MFTGLVEETGYVKQIQFLNNGAELFICCSAILAGLKTGDSVCVNGVCETVTKINSVGFGVQISDETLKVTTFKNMKQNDKLNLERALTLNKRLGGHIVSGHVDCVAKLIAVEQLSDFYNLTFEIPEKYAKYIVYKGSVTINGISLTVAEIKENVFKIAVIPHTFENTNLKNLQTGEQVNLETDILAKYIEKLLLSQDNIKTSKIDMNFLQENGFV